MLWTEHIRGKCELSKAMLSYLAGCFKNPRELLLPPRGRFAGIVNQMPWRAGPKREANKQRIYLTTGRLLRVNKSYLSVLCLRWIILEHAFG